MEYWNIGVTKRGTKIMGQEELSRKEAGGQGKVGCGGNMAHG